MILKNVNYEYKDKEAQFFTFDEELKKKYNIFIPNDFIYKIDSIKYTTNFNMFCETFTSINVLTQTFITYQTNIIYNYKPKSHENDYLLFDTNQ